MISTSIICLRRDADLALEAVDGCGNFHVEETQNVQQTTEYRESIHEVQEAVAKVRAIIDQLKLDKSGFLDAFRPLKPEKMAITSENWSTLATEISDEISKLKDTLDDFTTYLRDLQEQKSDLQKLRNMLETLQNMEADISFFEKMRVIYTAIASVPRKNVHELEKAMSIFPAIFQHCYLTKEAEFVCIALPRKRQEVAEKILKAHNAEILEIPKDMPRDLSKAKEDIDTRIQELLQNEKKQAETLKEMGDSNKGRLFALNEIAQNILTSLDAKKEFLQSDRLVTIKGFTPKKELDRLREKIDNNLNGNALVLGKQIKADEDPPTMFRNYSIFKPFEEITKLYGLPHYDELDPTPIIAITFPLIFGLMFGDLGHGLVLFAAGLLLGLSIKRQNGLKNFAWVLTACGIDAILSGLLFGEFFGQQIFHPLWFDPIQNVTLFLIFSLFIGIAQIAMGLVLEFVNFILKRDLIDAISGSLPRIAFYAGSIYLILEYKLNFGVWLRGPILFSLVPLVLVILGKPIASLTIRSIKQTSVTDREQTMITESFLEGGDLATRLLSNTISYTRILALLMVHWALLLATYAIAGIVAPASAFGPILSAIIIVAGNAFVMAFEGLIVFVQALRLHFYEWFSRFFQGTGTQFNPFKHGHVYSEIDFKKR